MDTEDEIKIEYYDYNESDPLRDLPTETANNLLIGNIVSPNYIPEYNIKNYQELCAETCDSITNNDEQKTSNIVDLDNLQMDETKCEATLYKVIDESGRYHCKLCGLTYSTIQTLRHHTKIKHPDLSDSLKTIITMNKRNSKVKCHICKRRFKLINDLNIHIKKNHILENVETSCRFCLAMFGNKKDMYDHLFNMHKKDLSKTVYSCDVCGYRTVKKSHIDKHRKTHTQEKDMKCQYCDYATYLLPNLKIHERVHTKDKPYLCDVENCGYQCSSKSALWSHQLKHNREKNMLYCDKCSYKTVYKQSLRKHMDSHRRNTLKVTL